MRRYRYILILAPISALISMIPDIGVHRYRHLPDIGNTRYRINADIGICRYRHHIRIYRYRRFPISAFPDIGVYRYRVYPISDIHRYRHNTTIYRYRRTYADIVSSLYPISCHIFRCREYCTRYRARCLEILPARGPAGLAFRLLAPVRNR